MFSRTPDNTSHQHAVPVEKSIRTERPSAAKASAVTSGWLEQVARRVAGASVRDLNTKIDTVPTNLIAGWFGFTRREFFEIQDPAERAVPQVRF